jgi:hypothetical protein
VTVIKGDWRTRRRVMYVRSFWNALRSHLHRFTLLEAFDQSWEWLDRRDRQRFCPHVPTTETASFTYCDDCGRTLRVK